jgi:hypothetical protein
VPSITTDDFVFNSFERVVVAALTLFNSVVVVKSESLVNSEVFVGIFMSFFKFILNSSTYFLVAASVSSSGYATLIIFSPYKFNTSDETIYNVELSILLVETKL